MSITTTFFNFFIPKVPKDRWPWPWMNSREGIQKVYNHYVEQGNEISVLSDFAGNVFVRDRADNTSKIQALRHQLWSN